MAQILSFRRGRQSHGEVGSDQKQDENSVKQILKAVLSCLTAVHMILGYELRRLATAPLPHFFWQEPTHLFLQLAPLAACRILGWTIQVPDLPGVSKAGLAPVSHIAS